SSSSRLQRRWPRFTVRVPVLVVGGLQRRRAMAQNGPSQRLAPEAIGLREVLFQSITHMAPAAGVAFSVIVGANFAAGPLPLSVVLALVGCLLVAVSIGQLARRLPSAGGVRPPAPPRHPH